MALDRLFLNTSSVGNTNAHIHPFDLGTLREAFPMRGTTPIGLPYAEKGIPTTVLMSNGEWKDDKRRKKHKNRDKEKKKDCKKHRYLHKESIMDKNKEKIRNGYHEFGLQNLQKQQDKKRRNDGSEDLSVIQRHQKSEFNYLKINQTGTLRIGR